MHRPLTIALCLLAAPLAATDEDAATVALHQLFADEWEHRLAEDPLFATDVGDRRYNHLLPGVSEADERRRAARHREFLARLRNIDRSRLAPADQVNYDVFEFLTEVGLNEHRFRAYLMPITGRTGFHVYFPQLPDRTPFETVADYENFVDRLRGFAAYAGQYIELMRAGIRDGYVLPRVVLEGYEGAIEAHIVEDPAESLLFGPFENFPDRIAAEDRQRLATEARKAIAESVVPGYRAFFEFMRDEYYPAAREEIAATSLPEGEEFYTHRVRRFTTLEVTAREVHEIGLAEVARIRAEMEAIIEQVGFEGSFAEFLAYLREEPRFYAETPEELLKEVSFVLKKMDGQLPRLFKTLPRTPYGVKPVPDFIAPKTYTAYYQPPTGDGTVAGFYFMNTYDLPSRPLYEVEALSLHEAVPGHHLQIALQQELTGLPDFRRYASITPFVEGWALYSERLGLEVGFYEDPYSNFGRLVYEMWRALRLVVDTGMHALGWGRQRAIDFMAENAGLSMHNIVTEVDRYIGWPGQALGYKMGELEIRKLRARAEEALGPAFDVREFHDLVLRNGAVPLPVLEAQVDDYIFEQSADEGDIDLLP